MKRVASAVFHFGVMLFPVCPTTLFAYEQATHQEITQQAAESSSVDSVLKNELQISRGIIETFLDRQVLRLLTDGSFLEDEPSTRSFNHFHNPLVNLWEQAGINASSLNISVRGQSSVLWQQNTAQDATLIETPLSRRSGGGNWSWQDARRFYSEALTRRLKEDRRDAQGSIVEAGRDSAFANAFLTLGHLTHLIQDASVPAHTRNDPHPLYEGYESWVRTYRQGGTDRRGRDRRGVFLGLLNQVPTSPTLSLDTSTRNSQAPVPMARLIDGDVFGGLNVDVLTGAGQGISEYTNGNFLSGDTVFQDFVLPRQDSLGSAFQEGGRTYFPKVQDGERVSHFVTEGTWLQRLFLRGVNQPGFVLDDRVYEDYAALLLPRAVGYSAALLDYFFRGRLEFELLPADDDPSQAKLVGFNRSADALGASGQLALYWEDTTGQRRPVEGPALTLAAAVEKNAALPELTFPWPDGAQRFVLAYRGPLGLEADAVVGKVTEKPALEQIYWNAVLVNDQYVFPWFLRTAGGVVVLPFEDFLAPGQTANDVRWGERDNMLVVQTFQFNDDFTGTAFVVFTFDRAEGSSIVPTTGALRYGRPVARIARVASVPLSALANLDLGTTVTVSHTHTQRQFVASYERRTNLATGTTWSPTVVELLDTSVEPYTQTFGLRLDRAHYPRACGEGACPHYKWLSDDFALTSAGDVLVLVTLQESSLPDNVRQIPALGHRPDGTVGQLDGNMIAIVFGFPDDSPSVNDFEKLRGVAWINLSQGAVLAKTMSDSVTLAQTTQQDGVRREVHDIVVNEAGETLLDEWSINIDARCSDPGAPGVTASVERQLGVLSLTYDGLYRRELRDLELERDFAIRGSASDTSFCLGVSVVQVTTVTSGPDPFPYKIQFGEFARKLVLPGNQALARFPLVFTRRSGQESQSVLWDALAGKARRLLQEPAPGSIRKATVNQRWALVDGFPEVHLVALDGAGTLDFPPEDQFGREFGDVYTLVAPDRLYNALDNKFYAVVGPELKPTKMPDSLAPVDPADEAWVNAPRWPYHVVRPR